MLGTLPIDYTQHVRDQTNGENVVCVREETNTSDYDGTYVVPTEGCLVDLSKSQTSALIWICDMCIVVVKVVKGSIASRGPGGHRGFDVCKLERSRRRRRAAK